MARNIATVLTNNFSRGLITEATGLNFPENAATEADNVVFEKVGRARRRKGFDLEGGAETLQYEDSDGVIKEFVWQSVALTGGFTFLVLQIGWNIHFFELTMNDALSQGIQPDSIDLREYKAAGAGQIQDTPASISSGAGYLFIAHPNCDPVVVRFNSEEDTFEVARINVLIRDLAGVEDGLTVSANPTEITSKHHYNLMNQGWFKNVRCGSSNNELVTAGGVSAADLNPAHYQGPAGSFKYLFVVMKELERVKGNGQDGGETSVDAPNPYPLEFEEL